LEAVFSSFKLSPQTPLQFPLLVSDEQKPPSTNSGQGSMNKRRWTINVLILGASVVCLCAWYFAFTQINIFAKNNTTGQFTNYPLKAIDALKERHKEADDLHILADYGWGGFIRWADPRFKVFIDGRMPSWHLGKDKSSNSQSKTEMTALELFQEAYKCDKSSDRRWREYKIDYLVLSRLAYEKNKSCYSSKTNLLHADKTSVLLAFSPMN